MTVVTKITENIRNYSDCKDKYKSRLQRFYYRDYVDNRYYKDYKDTQKLQALQGLQGSQRLQRSQ